MDASTVDHTRRRIGDGGGLRSQKLSLSRRTSVRPPRRKLCNRWRDDRPTNRQQDCWLGNFPDIITKGMIAVSARDHIGRAELRPIFARATLLLQPRGSIHDRAPRSAGASLGPLSRTRRARAMPACSPSRSSSLRSPHLSFAVSTLSVDDPPTLPPG